VAVGPGALVRVLAGAAGSFEQAHCGFPTKRKSHGWHYHQSPHVRYRCGNSTTGDRNVGARRRAGGGHTHSRSNSTTEHNQYPFAEEEKEMSSVTTASELTWGEAVKLAALLLLQQILYMIH
jgi:hypothetical protein